jgi:hypothetical protein
MANLIIQTPLSLLRVISCELLFQVAGFENIFSAYYFRKILNLQWQKSGLCYVPTPPKASDKLVKFIGFVGAKYVNSASQAVLYRIFVSSN